MRTHGHDRQRRQRRHLEPPAVNLRSAAERRRAGPGLGNELGPLAERLTVMDAEIRAACPKCPACGRPDGGFVPGGRTPHEAGLVDRERCPAENCPMRARASLAVEG